MPDMIDSGIQRFKDEAHAAHSRNRGRPYQGLEHRSTLLFVWYMLESIASEHDEIRATKQSGNFRRLLDPLQERIMGFAVDESRLWLGDEAGHLNAGLVECRAERGDILVPPGPELDRGETGGGGKADAGCEVPFLVGEKPLDAGRELTHEQEAGRIRSPSPCRIGGCHAETRLAFGQPQ
jgi:hypothetical protein